MPTYHQGRYTPKNPQKYIGNVSNIQYRSSWELKCMVFFDNNPNILKWNSEEIVVPYISPVDSKPHRYFLDFMVKYRTRNGEVKTALVEVKPESQTKPPVAGKKKKATVINEAKTYAVNTAKWEAATKYAKSKGLDFMVLTEKHIGV